MTIADDENTMASRTVISQAMQDYRRFFAAGERERWLSLFAPGASIEDPIGTHYRGDAAVASFFDTHRAAVDEIELIGLVEKICGRESMIHVEIWPTIAGRTFRFDVLEHLVFDDQGRIRSLRAFWDPAETRETHHDESGH